jgi:hypothetical protein
MTTLSLIPGLHFYLWLGAYVASLREQVAKENEASNPGTSSALNHIIKTMGSLANMSKVGPVSGGPGMGHVHGPHCQHGHDQGHAGHGGHDAGE